MLIAPVLVNTMLPCELLIATEANAPVLLIVVPPMPVLLVFKFAVEVFSDTPPAAVTIKLFALTVPRSFDAGEALFVRPLPVLIVAIPVAVILPPA